MLSFFTLTLTKWNCLEINPLAKTIVKNIVGRVYSCGEDEKERDIEDTTW